MNQLGMWCLYRSGLLAVVILLWAVGCSTSRDRVLLTQVEFRRSHDLLCGERREKRLDQLEAMRMELPPDVPLQFIPILEHINQTLAIKGIDFRLGVYFDPRCKSDHSSYYMQLEQVSTEFAGQTEVEIRKEINEGTILDCLYKLKLTFSATMLFFDDPNLIVFTPCLADYQREGKPRRAK